MKSNELNSYNRSKPKLQIKNYVQITDDKNSGNYLNYTCYNKSPFHAL